MSGYEHGMPSWVDVVADDVDAGVEFYEGLFGWRAESPGDPEETGGYRIFLKDGKRVAGIAPRNVMPACAWSTYVNVDDADAIAAKVAEAGGSVMVEPMDVMTAGRMAFFTDPAGAALGVWQAGDHKGAELVNDPGSFVWDELRTRDVEGSKSFYSELFGWGTQPFEGMDGYTIWTLGGDAPENGIGGMMDMDAAGIPAEIPAHWNVVFAVDDVDATAARCGELGGQVVQEAMDAAVGRVAGLQDPQGAMFTVIKLNQDPPR